MVQPTIDLHVVTSPADGVFTLDAADLPSSDEEAADAADLQAFAEWLTGQPAGTCLAVRDTEAESVLG